MLNFGILSRLPGRYIWRRLSSEMWRRVLALFFLFGGPRRTGAASFSIISHSRTFCQVFFAKILHKFLSRNLCKMLLDFPLRVWYTYSSGEGKPTQPAGSGKLYYNYTSSQLLTGQPPTAIRKLYYNYTTIQLMRLVDG